MCVSECSALRCDCWDPTRPYLVFDNELDSNRSIKWCEQSRADLQPDFGLSSQDQLLLNQFFSNNSAQLSFGAQQSQLESVTRQENASLPLNNEKEKKKKLAISESSKLVSSLIDRRLSFLSFLTSGQCSRVSAAVPCEQLAFLSLSSSF